MKIIDLEELRFTSIKYHGAIIHFCYKNEHYTLINGGNDCTLVVRLYKGRMKCHLEHIKSQYGYIPNLINFKYNKKVLKFVDKENFVNLLQNAKIIE